MVDVGLLIALVCALTACSSAGPSNAPQSMPTRAQGKTGAPRHVPTIVGQPTVTRSPNRPAPPPGPLPAAGAPLGTAHPYVLVATSAERRWTVLCQARADTTGDGVIEDRIGIHGETRGDEMVPYLVMGRGEGELIDDYVASDPKGRWLAIVQDDALLLIDSATGQRHDLSVHGADSSNDGSPFGGFRGGSFDDAGRLFAYVRNREGGRAVVIRDLGTQEETEIDPGPGLLHRSFIDGGGQFVVIEMVVRDTDGNGRVEPPTPRTSLSRSRCRGPIRSYSTSGVSGDEPETRVGRVGEDHVRPIPGLVRTFGERLIVRGADGGLGVRMWAGEPEPWVPASCQPDLVAIYPSADRMIVTCGALSAPQRAIVHAGQFQALAAGERAGSIGPLRIDARLYPAYSQRTLDVVDLQTGTIHHRRATYVANHGTRVLIGERNDLVSWEPTTGQLVRTPVGRRPRGGFAQQGQLVAIWGVLFDLEQNRVAGHYDGNPLALSLDAHLLVATTPAPTDTNVIPSGPLEWRPAH